MGKNYAKPKILTIAFAKAEKQVPVFWLRN